MLNLKTTDVRSRVEPDIKLEATAVLDQCGLTLSDGIRLFLRQVIAERGLPFEIKIPNATTQTAMQEARMMGKARFSNAQEMFSELDKQIKPKTRRLAAHK